jgi:hypothetical protein
VMASVVQDWAQQHLKHGVNDCARQRLRRTASRLPGRSTVSERQARHRDAKSERAAEYGGP